MVDIWSCSTQNFEPTNPPKPVEVHLEDVLLAQNPDGWFQGFRIAIVPKMAERKE